MSKPSYEHSVDNPIVNSPFEEPKHHWLVRKDHPPELLARRRAPGFFLRDTENKALFRTDSLDDELYRVPEDGGLVEFRLVAALREAVSAWREAGHPGADPRHAGAAGALDGREPRPREAAVLRADRGRRDGDLPRRGQR